MSSVTIVLIESVHEPNDDELHKILDAAMTTAEMQGCEPLRASCARVGTGLGEVRVENRELIEKWRVRTS
jgi:hypothetical protein